MKKAASIFLRADMEPADVRALSGWLQNQTVTRYLNEDAGASDALLDLLETTPAPLLTCRFNRTGRFFLVCDGEDDAIGFVKLQKQADPGCYEVVFAIGDERIWGNGYGTQALRAALAQVFLEWRGRKVTAKIYRGNTRSERTVRGCGFREEARLENLSRFTLTQADYLEGLTCPGEDGKLA
jgi:RimJ/RimL family protein N-acetyltransferase